MFKFFENGLVGRDFHFLFGLIEDNFLLGKGNDVTQEIIKNEGAGEVNHDDEEHDRHESTHLGRSHIVDFCLVELFALAGLFHELAETFTLGLTRGAKLLRGEILDETSKDGEEEGEDGTGASEAWVRLEVDDTKEAGVEFVGRGLESVLFLFRLRLVIFSGVVGGLFFHVFRLEIYDMLDIATILFDKGVSTEVEVGLVRRRINHDADGAEDGDKHR